MLDLLSVITYSQTGRNRSDEGTVVLGSPIGSLNFIQSVCHSFAVSGWELCHRLLSLKDLQWNAFVEIISCYSYQLTIWLGLSPFLLSSATEQHDIFHLSSNYVCSPSRKLSGAKRCCLSSREVLASLKLLRRLEHATHWHRTLVNSQPT
jgi:hypothetical protein